jgi:hypothetical protein
VQARGAAALAQAKVSVFIVARNVGPMEEAVRVIAKKTVATSPAVADVTTPEDFTCAGPDIPAHAQTCA